MAKNRTVYHRDYQVGHDYDGLRRALFDEYERHGRHELSLVDYHTNDNILYRLDLRPGTLEGLSPPVTEGWSVDPGLPGVKARVVSLDEDRDRIYVRFAGPRRGVPFFNTIRLIEPDFLLRLREWLDDNLGRPLPKLWDSLRDVKSAALSETESGLGASDIGSLRQAQRQAVLHSTQGLSYLWGPPGTGKTFTLARLVQSLLKRDFKVMVLAPTNVAVDTALLAIFRAFEHEPDGGFLVRAGYPELAALQEHPVLLAWQEVLRAQQRVMTVLERELRQVETDLTGAQREKRDRLQERQARLKSDRMDARDDQRRLLWNVANDARVLATTIHSALHVPEIIAFMSTPKLAVLIDEAAMVPRYAVLPLLEILAGEEGLQRDCVKKAPSEVVVYFAGDPRQLGPIYRQGKAQDVNRRFWLGQSLMEELLESAPSSDRRTFLNEQSRMDTTICRRVSRTYYQDQLTALADPQRPVPPLVPGWPEDGLVLLDPKQFGLPREAPPESFLDESGKFNERNLYVAMRLIREALEVNDAHSVLWLTPFRDQAKAARKFCDSYFSAARVRAGTVHTSQGGEADLVIFDPVTVGHRWLKGAMGDEIDIERMLNVAVSRARGQVIVLCSPNKARRNPIFWRLLHDAYQWDARNY